MLSPAPHVDAPYLLPQDSGSEDTEEVIPDSKSGMYYSWLDSMEAVQRATDMRASPFKATCPTQLVEALIDLEVSNYSKALSAADQMVTVAHYGAGVPEKPSASGGPPSDKPEEGQPPDQVSA